MDIKFRDILFVLCVVLFDSKAFCQYSEKSHPLLASLFSAANKAAGKKPSSLVKEHVKPVGKLQPPITIGVIISDATCDLCRKKNDLHCITVHCVNSKSPTVTPLASQRDLVQPVQKTTGYDGQLSKQQVPISHLPGKVVGETHSVVIQKQQLHTPEIGATHTSKTVSSVIGHQTSWAQDAGSKTISSPLVPIQQTNLPIDHTGQFQSHIPVPSSGSVGVDDATARLNSLFSGQMMTDHSTQTQKIPTVHKPSPLVPLEKPSGVPLTGGSPSDVHLIPVGWEPPVKAILPGQKQINAVHGSRQIISDGTGVGVGTVGSGTFVDHSIPVDSAVSQPQPLTSGKPLSMIPTGTTGDISNLIVKPGQHSQDIVMQRQEIQLPDGQTIGSFDIINPQFTSVNEGNPLGINREGAVSADNAVKQPMPGTPDVQLPLMPTEPIITPNVPNTPIVPLPPKVSPQNDMALQDATALISRLFSGSGNVGSGDLSQILPLTPGLPISQRNQGANQNIIATPGQPIQDIVMQRQEIQLPGGQTIGSFDIINPQFTSVNEDNPQVINRGSPASPADPQSVFDLSVTGGTPLNNRDINQLPGGGGLPLESWNFNQNPQTPQMPISDRPSPSVGTHTGMFQPFPSSGQDSVTGASFDSGSPGVPENNRPIVDTSRDPIPGIVDGTGGIPLTMSDIPLPGDLLNVDPNQQSPHITVSDVPAFRPGTADGTFQTMPSPGQIPVADSSIDSSPPVATESNRPVVASPINPSSGSLESSGGIPLTMTDIPLPGGGVPLSDNVNDQSLPPTEISSSSDIDQHRVSKTIREFFPDLATAPTEGNQGNVPQTSGDSSMPVNEAGSLGAPVHGQDGQGVSPSTDTSPPRGQGDQDFMQQLPSDVPISQSPPDANAVQNPADNAFLGDHGDQSAINAFSLPDHRNPVDLNSLIIPPFANTGQGEPIPTRNAIFWDFGFGPILPQSGAQTTSNMSPLVAGGGGNAIDANSAPAVLPSHIPTQGNQHASFSSGDQGVSSAESGSLVTLGEFGLETVPQPQVVGNQEGANTVDLTSSQSGSQPTVTNTVSNNADAIPVGSMNNNDQNIAPGDNVQAWSLGEIPLPTLNGITGNNIDNSVRNFQNVPNFVPGTVNGGTLPFTGTGNAVALGPGDMATVTMEGLFEPTTPVPTMNPRRARELNDLSSGFLGGFMS